MLKLVLADLLVDMHVFGVYVWIERERDEGGRAVVHGMRSAKGNLGKVCSGRDEGGREDDGVDVLLVESVELNRLNK